MMLRTLILIFVALLTPTAFASGRQAFSLAVTPTAISAPVGATIGIRFRVTNKSSQPRYVYRDTLTFVHLTITDAQGNMLLGGVPPPPPAPGQPAIDKLVLLAPGQSFSHVEHFDLGQPPTNKAGTYVFYFIVSVPSYVKGSVSADAINYFFSRDNVVRVTVTQK